MKYHKLWYISRRERPPRRSPRWTSSPRRQSRSLRSRSVACRVDVVVSHVPEAGHGAPSILAERLLPSGYLLDSSGPNVAQQLLKAVEARKSAGPNMIPFAGMTLV
jgi:hypothetical protein